MNLRILLRPSILWKYNSGSLSLLESSARWDACLWQWSLLSSTLIGIGHHQPLWILLCHFLVRGCKRKCSVSKLFENFGGTLGRKRAVSWANIITKGLSWVFGELATTRRCVNQQPTCTLSPCPSNRLSHWGWWDHGGFEEDYDVGAIASICYWLPIYIYPK